MEFVDRRNADETSRNRRIFDDGKMMDVVNT